MPPSHARAWKDWAQAKDSGPPVSLHPGFLAVRRVLASASARGAVQFDGLEVALAAQVGQFAVVFLSGDALACQQVP